MQGETGDDFSLLIDSHVHLHDCFPPATFLELAWQNFESAAQRRRWGPCLGVLMLTESAGVDWFGRLASQAASGGSSSAVPLDPWTIELTADPSALAAKSGRRQLLILAGRQVVAGERLEVLLLGTRATVPDGLPLSEILTEGARLGAIRVIPWGAGKWLFRRGRLLSAIIEQQPAGEGFFLGDSAGRPFFWPSPSHFHQAERRGIRVLGGTDPLPFPSQAGRPGSFGFRLEGALDLSRPAEAIKSALRDPASRLSHYGRLERALPFLGNQIAMQTRKRGRPAATGPSSRVP